MLPETSIIAYFAQLEDPTRQAQPKTSAHQSHHHCYLGDYLGSEYMGGYRALWAVEAGMVCNVFGLEQRDTIA